MYEVKYTEQVGKWLYSLPKDEYKSIIKVLELLKINGYLLGLPHARKISGSKIKLRELRCSIYGNRIYYIFKGDKIYICLRAGDKTSQKKDIKKSEKIAKQILRLQEK